MDYTGLLQRFSHSDDSHLWNVPSYPSALLNTHNKRSMLSMVKISNSKHWDQDALARSLEKTHNVVVINGENDYEVVELQDGTRYEWNRMFNTLLRDVGHCTKFTLESYETVVIHGTPKQGTSLTLKKVAGLVIDGQLVKGPVQLDGNVTLTLFIHCSQDFYDTVKLGGLTGAGMAIFDKGVSLKNKRIMAADFSTDGQGSLSEIRNCYFDGEFLTFDYSDEKLFVMRDVEAPNLQMIEITFQDGLIPEFHTVKSKVLYTGFRHHFESLPKTTSRWKYKFLSNTRVLSLINFIDPLYTPMQKLVTLIIKCGVNIPDPKGDFPQLADLAITCYGSMTRIPKIKAYRLHKLVIKHPLGFPLEAGTVARMARSCHYLENFQFDDNSPVASYAIGSLVRANSKKLKKLVLRFANSSFMERRPQLKFPLLEELYITSNSSQSEFNPRFTAPRLRTLFIHAHNLSIGTLGAFPCLKKIVHIAKLGIQTSGISLDLVISNCKVSYTECGNCYG